MSKQTANSIKLMPWITALLMVTGIAVVAALYWNQNVTIQKVKVNKLYFTEEEQVQKAAETSLGMKPDSLDLTALVYRIEQLEYVKSVSPYVEPNGNLKLNITEREPLALLMDDNNRIYVDEDGVKLSILKEKTVDVPLLYGFNGLTSKDTLKGDSFIQVRDFLVNAKRNGFGWATISEVAFDSNGGVVALSHENGVKLLFGKNDFANKLKNWEAFYAQVIRNKGIQSVQQVDLRYTNQVVTHEI